MQKERYQSQINQNFGIRRLAFKLSELSKEIQGQVLHSVKVTALNIEKICK
jgi:hypothetical protein